MARKMKDSGIEWIGEIPEGWEVIPIKYLARYNYDTLTESCSPDFEFNYIDIGSVTYGKGITTFQKFKFKDSPSRARRVVTPGDILISTVRTYLRAIACVNKSSIPQIASTGFLVLQADSSKLPPQFLMYAVLADSFICNVEAHSVGISYPAINASQIVHFKIPLPPSTEQIPLINYLDNHCSKIDVLLSKIHSSIEEYKKLKQAVITQAVTKGVRGEREMKDSGVEWIGEIPAEWKIQRFARVAEVKSNLVSPDNYLEYPQISPENIEKDSGKLLLPCRTVSEVGVISGNHLFYKGQILYSKIRPKLNKVCIAPFDGLCSADMYPIETNNDTRYIMYCILSNGFLQQVSMITENRVKMPKVNQVELSKILVAIPETIAEQKEIADYLDAKCAEIDGLIVKKEQLVKELESYKKSLIYEVVTGKREV